MLTLHQLVCPSERAGRIARAEWTGIVNAKSRSMTDDSNAANVAIAPRIETCQQVHRDRFLSRSSATRFCHGDCLGEGQANLRCHWVRDSSSINACMTSFMRQALSSGSLNCIFMDKRYKDILSLGCAPESPGASVGDHVIIPPSTWRP